MLKRGSLYSFRILVDSLSSWVAGAINPATPRTSKSYMGVSENRGPPNICTLNSRIPPNQGSPNFRKLPHAKGQSLLQLC